MQRSLAYMESVERFSTWARARDIRSVTKVTRGHIREWLELELSRVSAETTVHLLGVRQWFKWLASEGEIPTNPTEGFRQPAPPMNPTRTFIALMPPASWSPFIDMKCPEGSGLWV